MSDEHGRAGTDIRQRGGGMKIFIDCEFNGHGGALISMALVDEGGRSWYGIMDIPKHCPFEPWVEANVMPVLTAGEPIFYYDAESFALGIQQFLVGYDHIQVIADWPADIQYFCEALIYAPGVRVDTPPLLMFVDRALDTSASIVPHNAFADAVALREMYNEKYSA